MLRCAPPNFDHCLCHSCYHLLIFSIYCKLFDLLRATEKMTVCVIFDRSVSTAAFQTSSSPSPSRTAVNTGSFLTRRPPAVILRTRCLHIPSTRNSNHLIVYSSSHFYRLFMRDTSALFSAAKCTTKQAAELWDHCSLAG